MHTHARTHTHNRCHQCAVSLHMTNRLDTWQDTLLGPANPENTIVKIEDLPDRVVYLVLSMGCICAHKHTTSLIECLYSPFVCSYMRIQWMQGIVSQRMRCLSCWVWSGTNTHLTYSQVALLATWHLHHLYLSLTFPLSCSHWAGHNIRVIHRSNLCKRSRHIDHVAVKMPVENG